MKRFLAVVASLGLVLAALAVRGTFSGSDGGGGGGGTPSGLTIACPPELREVCQAEFGDGAVIEDPATTLARLAGSDIGVDAWLVSRSWAGVARAEFAQQIESVTTTTASSPIVIAIWKDRRAALDDGGCEPLEFGLACLGETAGQAFSDLNTTFPERVQVGFASVSTMTGLDVRSAAASSYFGSVTFPSNDFDTDFRTWLRDLQQGPAGGPELLDQMFTLRTGFLTAVVGLEADLRPIHEVAATREQVDLVATRSSSELIVVDLTGGPDASGTAEDPGLLDALLEAGWRIEGRDGAAPLSTVGTPIEGESTDGMAVVDGVLAALRDLAESV